MTGPAAPDGAAPHDRTHLTEGRLLVGGEGHDLPLQRILHVDAGAGGVALIDVEAPGALPHWRPLADVRADLENGILAPAIVTPLAPPVLSAAAAARRDRRWAAIRDIVLDPTRPDLDEARRGAAVARAVDARRGTAHKVTDRTVYACLRLYWQRGQTREALAPTFERCGGPGVVREPGAEKRGPPSALGKVEPGMKGVNVDADARAALQRGYKRFFLGQEQPVIAGGKASIAKAYRDTLSHFFRVGMEWNEEKQQWVAVLPPAQELPTRVQFAYWGRKLEEALGAEAVSRRRRGTRAHALRHRPLAGTARSIATGPGAVYQVDATVGDIYIVSGLLAGRIIGRPVIYVVLDVYSGMVVGFHVALASPSWDGMRLALEHAMCDKVEFCRRFGVTITAARWPTVGKPQAILGDRGELLSAHADWLVDTLQIRVSNTASYRADWKGLVERYFRLINDDALKHLPGWVPGAVHRRERGTPDCRYDAKLTLDALVKLLTELFLHHNNDRRLTAPDALEPQASYEGVEPYPIDIWNWGLVHRSGALREASREEVRMALLPGHEATPTGRGLRVNGLLHTLPADVPGGWPLRGGRAARPLNVASDPRDVTYVFVRQAGGQPPIACPLHPKFARFAGRTLDEVRDQIAVENQHEQRSRTRRINADVALDERMQAIVGDLPDAPARSPADLRQGGSRGPRREEHAARGRAGASDAGADTTIVPLAGAPTRALGAAGPAGDPTAPDDGYVPPPDELALLRAARATTRTPTHAPTRPNDT